jgi:hypothetical protein
MSLGVNGALTPRWGGVLMARGSSIVDMFGIFLLDFGRRGRTVGLVDLPLVGMVATGAEA